MEVGRKQEPSSRAWTAHVGRGFARFRFRGFEPPARIFAAVACSGLCALSLAINSSFASWPSVVSLACVHHYVGTMITVD
jgi:hypothetical protein